MMDDIVIFMVVINAALSKDQEIACGPGKATDPKKGINWEALSELDPKLALTNDLDSIT